MIGRLIQFKCFLFEPVSAVQWTRFFFLRGLGFIYSIAFLILYHQAPGLVGDQGLMPASVFLDHVHSKLGAWPAFWRLPSVFHFFYSDTLMHGLSLVGLLVSLLVLLGLSSGLVLFLLWALYLSFLPIGQTFYGFGWESILLEMGFFSVFLVPFWGWRPFPNQGPPRVMLWVYWWVVFRMMFGAGLIKIRGDESWRDLTALFTHFETQPIPNMFSRWFHFMPRLFLKFGVLFNHFVELVVPFFFFGTRPFRFWAAMFTFLFQVVLIISGNLSFLNWLTVLACLPLLEDGVWKRILPQSLWEKGSSFPAVKGRPILDYLRQFSLVLLVGMVLYYSVFPIRNMLGPKQVMNRSYNAFHLVNTYGAFGSVGTIRRELILYGTMDRVISDQTQWLEYDFYAKPGDPSQRPRWFAPYHYRLDWQIWFAAMSPYYQNPWLVHLVKKLLEGQEVVLDLLPHDPFQGQLPTYIKVDLYAYQFAPLFGPEKRYWNRRYVGSYLPPLSKGMPALNGFLKQFGWE